MATEDEIVQYEKWKAGQGSFVTKFVKNISGLQFIFLMALIGGFILLWRNSEDKYVKVFVGLGIVAVFIFFYSKSKVDILITEEQAKIIVRENLDRKVGDELPTGIGIDVGPYCKVVGSRWDVQVTLKYPDGLVREGKMQVGLRGGFISGFEEMLTGFTGKDEGKAGFEPVVVERFVEEE